MRDQTAKSESPDLLASSCGWGCTPNLCSPKSGSVLPLPAVYVIEAIYLSLCKLRVSAFIEPIFTSRSAAIG